MIVNTVALEKGLRIEFNKAYEAMGGGDPYIELFNALATVVPSNSTEEKYGWFGDVPAVAEWLGDKAAGVLEDYDYTIKNKNFYTALDIDRNEVDDDKLGALLPRMQMLAQTVKAYKGQLIANLLINGTAGLAYDGSAFFANRAAPNDNLLAGTGVTLATFKADVYAARAAMMKFQTDAGKVMGLRMDTLVVPPELEGVAYEAVSSTMGVAGDNVANPINKWIKQIIVLPNATDATDWYGLASGFPLKPFVFQDRAPVELVLDDTQVKRNRKLVYSAEMRGNAGYGFFQMAVKTVNA